MNQVLQNNSSSAFGRIHIFNLGNLCLLEERELELMSVGLTASGDWKEVQRWLHYHHGLCEWHPRNILSTTCTITWNNLGGRQWVRGTYKHFPESSEIHGRGGGLWSPKMGAGIIVI